MEYQHWPLWKKWPPFFLNFPLVHFFPITHPRFNFNIYAWLHLKHLCMDICACLVYPTSHLCVVLHFLIFILIILYHLSHVCQNILTTVTCESLSIDNGQVNYNVSGVTDGNSDYYYVDTMASFLCNPGYSLSGSDSTICQTSEGGTWNEQAPSCIQSDEMIIVTIIF